MRTFPLPLFDLEGMTQFLEAHSSSIHAVSRRGTTRGCSPGSVTFVTVISVPADAVRTCCTDRLEIRLTTPPKRKGRLSAHRKENKSCHNKNTRAAFILRARIKREPDRISLCRAASDNALGMYLRRYRP